MRDPLLVVREALERRGCNPTGPAWKSTARCPAHDDREPSLSIAEGVDGRALLWCFAGCSAEDIVQALGLTWPDMFPPGHHHARPIRGLVKTPRRMIDLVLQALRELGIAYRPTRNPHSWVAWACPRCQHRPGWNLWIHEHDEDRHEGRVELACGNGCAQVDIMAALAGLHDDEQAVAQ